MKTEIVKIMREKADKLRVKKKEMEKGIAVMIPTNMQELLMPMAVVESISERTLEILVAGVYRLVKPIIPQEGDFEITEFPGNYNILFDTLYLSPA